MKVASWNVNSLNVRLPHVLRWLETAEPDVLGLQETKLPDDRFPAEAFTEAGYHVVYAGQKTYNGVALIARRPLSDVVFDPPGLDDPDRRVVAATVDGLRVINLYVVNGRSVDDPKYQFKLEWLNRIHDWLAVERQQNAEMVVMGDFNIAPADGDVHDPDRWRDSILCSPPERERLKSLLDLGLVDAYRRFDQPSGVFSWYDYRTRGFQRGLGLRIDLTLVSEALEPRLTAAGIDLEPRGWERPSDHAPVWVQWSDRLA
ncbi:MAG: exodeoxyribonuclease III [Thioalkalivibrionaceae bacterium]